MNIRNKDWLKNLYFSEHEFPWFDELAPEIATELNMMMTESIHDYTGYWIEAADVTPELQIITQPLITDELTENLSAYRERMFCAPHEYTHIELMLKLYKMYEEKFELNLVS